MKITIPENIGEITLLKFQLYKKLLDSKEDLSTHDFEKRKVSLFTGMSNGDLDLISQIDFKEINNHIDKALTVDVEFTPTFIMGGIEFGFIPNLDKITGGEFFDLSSYGVEVDKLHNLMAVLFRPIKSKDVFGNYSIVTYEGTDEYANAMKAMPLNIVNGALVFFSNLANELISHTQKYTKMEQARVKKPQSIS